MAYSDRTCVADAVSLTVSGTTGQGRLQTPDGRVVDVTGILDQDLRLEGVHFRLTAQDLIPCAVG